MQRCLDLDTDTFLLDNGKPNDHVKTLHMHI